MGYSTPGVVITNLAKIAFYVNMPFKVLSDKSEPIEIYLISTRMTLIGMMTRRATATTPPITPPE